MIKVVMLAGTRKGEVIEIQGKDVVRIGRDPDCEVHLTDSNVSRIHASLEVRPDGVWLVDCESTNGSFVNGAKADKHLLSSTDVVALGSSVFRVEHEPAKTATDAATVVPGGPGRTGVTGLAEWLGDSSVSLPEMVDHEEYQRLFECLLVIQNILNQDRAGMVEESLKALFLVLPVTRLSILRVLPEGKVQQWFTTTRLGPTTDHVSHTFARKVLEANKAVLIHDAFELDENEWGRTMQEQEVRSILGVPVYALGSAVAVLLCDNLEQPNILQEIHVRILEFAGKALQAVFQRDAIRQLEESQADTERVFLAAKRVQSQIFNRHPPSDMGGLRWALQYQPALDVGGDFYAFHHYQDRVQWVVADVAGKGIPAALVVSMLKGFCKVLFPQKLGPRALLAALSELLDGELPPYMFLTAIVVEVDTDGVLTCANAGHNTGFVFRQVNDPSATIKLTSSGNPIGFVGPAEFTERIREQKVQLCKGDRICLYTDGVTEARNSAGQFFGENSLTALLGDTRELGVEETLKDLVWRLEQFQGPKQNDDITIVLGQY